MVFCKNCKHVTFENEINKDCHCKAFAGQTIDPISGRLLFNYGPNSFCSVINKKCDCKYYEYEKSFFKRWLRS